MFGGLFSRKNKNIEPPMDFSFLKTDMHSHLIPGVDDGSQSLEESVLLIKELYGLGFRKLIATPHVMHDFYRNSNATICAGLEQLRSAVKLESGLDGLILEASAEYYADEGLREKIEKKEILTFGTNFLLFEISYINAPDNLDDLVFAMQTNGYQPVLAHPERYPFWYDQFEKFTRLKDKGVLFQVNSNSLTGYYSPGAKRFAERLIDNNMVEFLGTDTHNARHMDSLKKCMSEKYLKIISEKGVLNSQL